MNFRLHDPIYVLLPQRRFFAIRYTFSLEFYFAFLSSCGFPLACVLVPVSSGISRPFTSVVSPADRSPFRRRVALDVSRFVLERRCVSTVPAFRRLPVFFPSSGPLDQPFRQ